MVLYSMVEGLTNLGGSCTYFNQLLEIRKFAMSPAWCESKWIPIRFKFGVVIMILMNHGILANFKDQLNKVSG